MRSLIPCKSEKKSGARSNECDMQTRRSREKRGTHIRDSVGEADFITRQLR